MDVSLRGVWAATLMLIRVFWGSVVGEGVEDEAAMEVRYRLKDKLSRRKIKFVTSNTALIP